MSLVKGVASDEERKEIFQREKELRSKRRMQRKKERRLKVRNGTNWIVINYIRTKKTQKKKWR